MKMLKYRNLRVTFAVFPLEKTRNMVAYPVLCNQEGTSASGSPHIQKSWTLSFSNNYKSMEMACFLIFSP